MDFWQFIEKEIQDKTRTFFSINQKRSISGGDISHAYHLIGDKTDYFIKINQPQFSSLFEQEAVGLASLSLTNTFRIPVVITQGIFDAKSYLILEYIALNQAGKIENFAKALAHLHRQSSNKFGFAENNYIGNSIQKNQWNIDWCDFFTLNRLTVQLQQMVDNHVPTSLIDQGYLLLDKLPLILNHKPKPALVHGDLWQGNYAFDRNQQPVIYDPACYYGDHEVDLAMLELFGNPQGSFFETYQQIYPIHVGYSKRKDIYNLYHLFNHVNLFAGGYVQQAKNSLNRLLS